MRSLPSTRLFLAFALFLTMGGVTGCGSSGESPNPEGALSKPPGLLSAKEIRSQPPSSPQQTVLSALFYWQWGSIPSVVREYAPEAVSSIGAQTFVATIGFQRPYVSTVRPRISFVRRVAPSAMLVGIDLLSQDAATSHESFLVRRRGGRWQIVYDTLVDRSLVPYQISQPGGEGSKPSKRAQNRARQFGQNLANAYRVNDAAGVGPGRAVRTPTSAGKSSGAASTGRPKPATGRPKPADPGATAPPTSTTPSPTPTR
jgi:hypothetical protein